MSSLVSRNVRVKGHRTSVRLEPELWDALDDICAAEGTALHDLCDRIDALPRRGGFTSAVRVYILRYFRDVSRDDGLRRAA